MITLKGCVEGMTKEMMDGAVHIWAKRAIVPIPEGAEQWPEEPEQGTADNIWSHFLPKLMSLMILVLSLVHVVWFRICLNVVAPNDEGSEVMSVTAGSEWEAKDQSKLKAPYAFH